MKTTVSLITVMTLFITGCAGMRSEIPEAVRIGVYAETAAIHAGRYDLAEKYGDNLLRIVPAPKVRLHFSAVLRTVDKTKPPEKINVAPLDAAPLTLRIPDTGNLLDTPGALAEAAAADKYTGTTDKQQISDDKKSKEDATLVQKQKVELAAQAKWKYMVLTAVALFILSVLAYVAWKLKWFGI